MKKLFYLGIVGLILFEIANVFFIMPMPGSQEMRSVGVAYFLHEWRWVFRAVFGLLAVAGFWVAFQGKKWAAILAVAATAVVVWQANFEMAADHMFFQPKNLQMKNAAANTVPLEKLVLGVAKNGDARAYPIQQIGYHHQVQDSLAGEPIMVTYCTVCRTGRVFRPFFGGRRERFRLVGMDHFNAMFEDATTKTWWRQATGEAVAGPLAGQVLPEIFSEQMTLAEWLRLNPNSLVMQADTTNFGEEYKDMASFDTGKGRGKLTRTDSLSWQRKSWVVGIQLGAASKAFDWNRLKTERIVQDFVGKTPVAVVMAADTMSFFAFERPSAEAKFLLKNDTLYLENQAFNLKGEPLGGGENVVPLRRVQAHQEFWHSWETFHPGTERY